MAEAAAAARDMLALPQQHPDVVMLAVELSRDGWSTTGRRVSGSLALVVWRWSFGAGRSSAAVGRDRILA